VPVSKVVATEFGRGQRDKACGDSDPEVSDPDATGVLSPRGPTTSGSGYETRLCSDCVPRSHRGPADVRLTHRAALAYNARLWGPQTLLPGVTASQ